MERIAMGFVGMGFVVRGDLNRMMERTAMGFVGMGIVVRRRC